MVDSKDVKGDGKEMDPFAEKLQFLADQLSAVRASVRSLWGTKVLTVTLPLVFVINSDVGGNTANATAVNPSSLTEFTELADVFDEFRVVGGELEFTLPLLFNGAASLQPYISIGYDPSDVTTPTSNLLMAQLQNNARYAANYTSVTSVVPIIVNNKMHKFPWKTPKGVFEANTANGAIGDMWQAVDAATKFSYGSIKQFAVGSQASVTTAVSGILYYHTEFRCRV